jgi:glycosyltransferase involved in cell wall biosynthesis
MRFAPVDSEAVVASSSSTGKRKEGNRMRIGYCIPGWPPGSVPNGIASTYGNLGRQLREMGHEVFYVAMYSESPVRDPYVTVLDDSKEHTFIEKLRFKLNFESGLFRATSDRIAAAVNELVRNRAIDIFQMEETHGWAQAVIERVPIPVVVRLHGPWFLLNRLVPTQREKPENRHREKREGQGLRAAAGVTAPSRVVLQNAMAHYRLDCPTQVIANPVPVGSDAIYWKLNTCDRNLILFVGRFDHVKGADILLKAFAQLARERLGIRLMFVGPDVGLAIDGAHHVHFAEFMEREIPATLHDRIQYCGSLSRDRIQQLRAQACLTVVSSRFENFPNTVTEAMAAGCPIVATNTGGIPEILLDKRNGLLAPPDNVDGLAQAIARLLDDPRFAAKLGEQATKDSHEWLAPQKIAEQTIDFYSRLIASQRST